MTVDATLSSEIVRFYVVLVGSLIVLGGLALLAVTAVSSKDIRPVWRTYRGWLIMAPLAFGFLVAGRTAFIVGGVRQCRNLYKIEVVQKTDPGDAGQDVDPDNETSGIERNPHRSEGDDDREDDAADYYAGDRIQRVHCDLLPDIVVVVIDTILDQI